MTKPSAGVCTPKAELRSLNGPCWWVRLRLGVGRALLAVSTVFMTGTCDAGGRHGGLDAGEPIQLGRGDPLSAAFQFSATDSQGVVVLESTGSVWQGGSAWVVSDSPRIRIGVSNGNVAYEFARVTDVTVLSDGHIVVADAGNGQLRFFDSGGAYLSAIGALGVGPGEFKSIRSFSVRGDVLIAFDDRLQRVSRFRLDGQLIDSTPLQDEARRGGGGLADVRAVGNQLFAIEATQFTAGSPGQVTRDTIHVLEVDALGTGRRYVAALPGVPIQHLSLRGRPVSRPIPLAPTPTWDASAEGFYIALGEHLEVIAYGGPDGRERRIQRRAPLIATESTDISRWRSILLEGLPRGQRSSAGDLLEALSFPEFLPAYSAVRAGPEGEVWAGQFVSPGVDPPSQWDVYAADGRYLGQVTTPRGLQVFEVGRDYVAGSWSDTLGVEFVHVHDLDRG